MVSFFVVFTLTHQSRSCGQDQNFPRERPALAGSFISHASTGTRQESLTLSRRVLSLPFLLDPVTDAEWSGPAAIFS